MVTINNTKNAKMKRTLSGWLDICLTPRQCFECIGKRSLSPAPAFSARTDIVDFQPKINFRSQKPQGWRTLGSFWKKISSIFNVCLWLPWKLTRKRNLLSNSSSDSKRTFIDIFWISGTTIEFGGGWKLLEFGCRRRSLQISRPRPQISRSSSTAFGLGHAEIWAKQFPRSLSICGRSCILRSKGIRVEAPPEEFNIFYWQNKHLGPLAMFAGSQVDSIRPLRGAPIFDRIQRQSSRRLCFSRGRNWESKWNRLFRLLGFALCFEWKQLPILDRAHAPQGQKQEKGKSSVGKLRDAQMSI